MAVGWPRAASFEDVNELIAQLNANLTARLDASDASATVKQNELDTFFLMWAGARRRPSCCMTLSCTRHVSRAASASKTPARRRRARKSGRHSHSQAQPGRRLRRGEQHALGGGALARAPARRASLSRRPPPPRIAQVRSSS